MLAYYINQALWLTLLISAPIVVVTVLIGLVLGFLQAIFQLQDQSLPFGVKLLGVTLIVFALGAWQSQSLIAFTDTMFSLLPIKASAL